MSVYISIKRVNINIGWCNVWRLLLALFIVFCHHGKIWIVSGWREGWWWSWYWPLIGHQVTLWPLIGWSLLSPHNIAAPPIHLTQPLPGAVHCASVQRHLKVKKISCHALIPKKNLMPPTTRFFRARKRFCQSWQDSFIFQTKAPWDFVS